jgi:hypothetical protein
MDAHDDRRSLYQVLIKALLSPLITWPSTPIPMLSTDAKGDMISRTMWISNMTLTVLRHCGPATPARTGEKMMKNEVRSCTNIHP